MLHYVHYIIEENTDKGACLSNIGKAHKKRLIMYPSNYAECNNSNSLEQLMEMLKEGRWKTIFLLVCLHIPCHWSIKVFVTKYNFTGFVPDQNSYNGLTLRRDPIGNPRRLEQITLCFRVKLEYFLLMGQHSPLLDLLDGGGWEEGVKVEENKLRLLEFYIKDPIENLHRLRVKTFTAKIVEARHAGNRNWHWPKFKKPANIKEWNHFCIGYSSITKKLILMHNGNVEVEHTRPALVNEVDDFIPSQWLGRLEDGSKKEGEFLTRRGILVLKKENVQGSLTDLNVWDSLLSKEEMQKFTMCTKNLRGNILPWKGEDWEMSPEIGSDEYEVVERSFDQICSPPSRFLFFQERITWREAIKVCSKFQAKLVVTEVEDDYHNLQEYLSTFTTLPVWLRFTDGGSEGVWVDYETKRSPKFDIPWLHISEPTGFVGMSFNTFLDKFINSFFKKLRTVPVSHMRRQETVPLTWIAGRSTRHFARYQISFISTPCARWREHRSFCSEAFLRLSGLTKCTP